LSNIRLVILSGGYGTRLWPLSRQQYPKQYLSLATDKTMLQETILRLKDFGDFNDPIIVCNSEHRFLVAEQCKEINVFNPVIILEPTGRNTAPAITAAALKSIKDNDSKFSNEDDTLLVLSADHVIQNIDAFYEAIETAYQQAQKENLVIFGIVPTEVNTGYGYIKSSKKISHNVYEVDSFVEKPDADMAKSYIKQGAYLWNSGMFMFKARAFIKELSAYSPEIANAVSNSFNNSIQDMDFIRLEEKSFKSSPSISIDYALMEKSENIAVVTLDAGWNDIGSWAALFDIGQKDSKGNLIKGNVIAIETSNTYVNANERMLATLGVQDLIIVDTPDATLIISKNEAHRVKDIVNQLTLKDSSLNVQHSKVHRPWGWYDTIESGEFFQVKRLHVNPGAKLSLQMHNMRAEHWVVVSGVATATNGDELLTLSRGQSTYIPKRVIHSLENKKKEPLEIIEVQSGSYLGEDDIVRYEDIYGRTEK
jgi:mannose-1-phosphate guanylyltransferase / mannose-6-phosphate isomerase